MAACRWPRASLRLGPLQGEQHSPAPRPGRDSAGPHFPRSPVVPRGGCPLPCSGWRQRQPRPPSPGDGRVHPVRRAVPDVPEGLQGPGGVRRGRACGRRPVPVRVPAVQRAGAPAGRARDGERERRRVGSAGRGRERCRVGRLEQRRLNAPRRVPERPRESRSRFVFTPPLVLPRSPGGLWLLSVQGRSCGGCPLARSVPEAGPMPSLLRHRGCDVCGRTQFCLPAGAIFAVKSFSFRCSVCDRRGSMQLTPSTPTSCLSVPTTGTDAA